MDAASIQSVLPWRHPFLMIDRMLSCTPHQSITTTKQVTASDPAVNDSGADGAWLPGVLLLEGLSQSAALLYALSYAAGGRVDLPLLGFLSARLTGSAAVGESIRYDVRAQKMTRQGGVFDAEAHAGERLIARAELAFSMARDAEGAGP